jgi:hypothetical protein
MKKLLLLERAKRLMPMTMGSCMAVILRIQMGTFGKHSGWIQSDYQKNKMRDPIDTYISEAPQEHQEALIKIRDILRKGLVPLGFEECITYGMIGYIVPFSTYPQGYHTDRKQPLPFVCLATKKAGVHLYHM